ncbi:TonB-dependent receptor [Gemmatimonadetes bacterium T265]|nr:TonB-dependent receptor [Gemmatimonadetes bacterium T265]
MRVPLSVPLDFMSSRRGLLVAASCFVAPAAVRAQTRGELRGTVVAAVSGQPVASASVAVRRVAGGGGAASGGADTALAGGATARADGTFRVERLRPGRYTLRVRALGYAPLVRAVTVPDAGGPVDLGRLALATVAAQLGGVKVEGQQEQATLAPDRNTFQTKDLPAAAGGTAIDVLRNVPQVEVDTDNNVSVRGNQNVTVQINGRPTPLKGQQLGNYLAQLPANLVAKVDVVTNPSAKNDPDGQAGIINITLTQRTDLGTSGGVQASTSTTGLVNLNGNVGRQQGPWTGFASYGFFHDNRHSSGTSDQFNGGDVPSTLASTLTGRQRPQFHSATLRGEYKLAEHDALAADVVFNTGAFRRTSDAAYVAADAFGTPTARYAQFTSSRYPSTTGDYALAYRHTVDPEKNALSVELRLNDAQPGFDSQIVPQSVATTQAATAPAAGVPTRTTERERTPTWRFQTDWTRGLGANTKLEAGLLGIRRRQSAAFSAAADSGAGYADLAGQDNAFTYHENVASVYSVLTQKAGPWQFQGGLRLEQATTRFDLAAATAGAEGQHFDNGYKSAFPSALVAYNLDPTQQVKASYSRRINRPDPSQLNPFVERQDAYSIFQGNPTLRPEYTDSYELGYQRSFAKGSLQISPYYRHTPHAVRYIRTVDTAGVTRATFANVALSTSYGTDLNGTLRLARFTLFGGGSVFGVSTDAHNVTPDVSFRGAGWNARGNATFKATPLVDLQAFVFYRAPQAVEGGRMRGFTWNSLALKRKLGGDQTTLTLSAQDPFNLVAFGMRTVNGPLVLTTDQHFGARSLRVSFNHTFGKPPQFRPQTNDAGEQQPQGGGGGPPG